MALLVQTVTQQINPYGRTMQLFQSSKQVKAFGIAGIYPKDTQHAKNFRKA